MDPYLNGLLEQYIGGEITPEQVARDINAYFDGRLTQLHYNQKRFTLGNGLERKSMPETIHDRKVIKKVVELVLALADLVEENGGQNNIRISKDASTKHRTDGLKKLKEKS